MTNVKGGALLHFLLNKKNSNHLRICLNNCVLFLLIYSEFYLESCFAMTYCNVLSKNAKSSMSYKMRAMPMEWDRKRKNNVHRGLHTSGKSNPEPD